MASLYKLFRFHRRHIDPFPEDGMAAVVVERPADLKADPRFQKGEGRDGKSPVFADFAVAPLGRAGIGAGADPADDTGFPGQGGLQIVGEFRTDDDFSPAPFRLAGGDLGEGR